VASPSVRGRREAQHPHARVGRHGAWGLSTGCVSVRKDGLHDFIVLRRSSTIPLDVPETTRAHVAAGRALARAAGAQVAPTRRRSGRLIGRIGARQRCASTMTQANVACTPRRLGSSAW